MTPPAVWRALSGYFDNPDPFMAVGGTVALVVVGNQPFYPFYVWYAVDQPVPSAFLTWLSMPLFLAAPALMRRSPAIGRAVLLLAAIGNTLLSVKALGSASGVEVFYLPCLLLAGVLLLPARRAGPVGLAVAAIVASLVLGRWASPSLAALSSVQSHALAVMHAISVGCLSVVIGFAAFRARRDAILAGGPRDRRPA